MRSSGPTGNSTKSGQVTFTVPSTTHASTGLGHGTGSVTMSTPRFSLHCEKA
jgi:hypothetical protein